jgi:prepilin-type N-terminal cleavage/methylation domain-containing protein
MFGLQQQSREAESYNGRRAGAGVDRGFTLIELLVVIAIISILASMLLPSLSRAKEKGHTATCINNLRNMGLSIQMYVDDYESRYPANYVIEQDPASGQFVAKTTRIALGGRDPDPRYRGAYPSARARPLYSYMAPSEVYRCPKDGGQWNVAFLDASGPPSDWQIAGNSYYYNSGALTVPQGGGTLKPQDDPANGIAGKPEGWASEPSRYILMHETPARPFGTPTGDIRWYQWHYSGRGNVFADPRFAPRQFIAGTLFVDGHVRMINFSSSLVTDVFHPYEPRNDWIWYRTSAP